jgi:hypothetical protein
MLFRAKLDAKSERMRMNESPSHENPARIAGNRPRTEPGREFPEWKSRELQRKFVLQKIA